MRGPKYGPDTQELYCDLCEHAIVARASEPDYPECAKCKRKFCPDCCDQTDEDSGLCVSCEQDSLRAECNE